MVSYHISQCHTGVIFLGTAILLVTAVRIEILTSFNTLMIDCNFSGPGGEKRSVRELAAGLIKHGGPESDGKKKIGSHSESGWKISTNNHAIYGYLCIANVCFHIETMLLQCTLTLLLYKHTHVDGITEKRQ
jgi:hypothetical protein